MIKYKTEDECVVNKQWVCDGFAEDVESKIWAKGRHFYTRQSGIESAVMHLIEKLKNEKLLS